MAKVELSKIRLAVTAISKSVVATIPNRDGLTMKHKHDVTSDFLQAIIDYGKNTRFNISIEGQGGKECQVCVKELTEFKNEIFTRKEVIELFGKFISDVVGKDIPYNKWVEDNLK